VYAGVTGTGDLSTMKLVVLEAYGPWYDSAHVTLTEYEPAGQLDAGDSTKLKL